MKFNNLILYFSIIFLMGSCKNELELYPEDALSDPSFWKTDQDLELYASRFYTNLPGAMGPGRQPVRLVCEQLTKWLSLWYYCSTDLRWRLVQWRLVQHQGLQLFFEELQ